jgi:hypothetical protein
MVPMLVDMVWIVQEGRAWLRMLYTTGGNKDRVRLVQ